MTADTKRVWFKRAAITASYAAVGAAAYALPRPRTRFDQLADHAPSRENVEHKHKVDLLVENNTDADLSYSAINLVAVDSLISFAPDAFIAPTNAHGKLQIRLARSQREFPHIHPHQAQLSPELLKPGTWREARLNFIGQLVVLLPIRRSSGQIGLAWNDWASKIEDIFGGISRIAALKGSQSQLRRSIDARMNTHKQLSGIPGPNDEKYAFYSALKNSFTPFISALSSSATGEYPDKLVMTLAQQYVLGKETFYTRLEEFFSKAQVDELYAFVHGDVFEGVIYDNLVKVGKATQNTSLNRNA